MCLVSLDKSVGRVGATDDIEIKDVLGGSTDQELLNPIWTHVGILLHQKSNNTSCDGCGHGSTTHGDGAVITNVACRTDPLARSKDVDAGTKVGARAV